MVTQSISEAVGQVLQQRVQALYGNLQPGLRFQTVGQGGSQLVYPQGTLELGSVVQYYYPTFAAFNKYVIATDHSDFEISTANFVSYLRQFYSALVYGLSAKQYQQLADSQNEQNRSISGLFDLMIGGLGVGSSLWTEAGGLTSSWSWPSLQCTLEDPETPSDQDLPVNTQWSILSNSISYICKVASLNSSIALEPAYQLTPWTELSSQLLGGMINDWDQIFTGRLTNDLENPWNDDSYQKFVSIVRSLDQSNQVVADQAQRSAVVNSASSYLSNYVTENGSQLDSNLLYDEVANASGNGYPSVIPSASYLYSSDYVQSILDGAGETISMSAVAVASADSDVVAIRSQSVPDQQAQASMNDWGVVQNAANGSVLEDVDIGSYDPTVSVVSGSFDYDNVGVQVWLPDTQGDSAWLLAEAIQEAVASPTPYVYSSNFEGGYGWTNSSDAQAFTEQGVAYISAMAYAGSAVSTLTGGSSDLQMWSQAALDDAGLSMNLGVNFGDWYASSITSSQSSAQAVKPSFSTTSSQSGSRFQLVSNPMGPISSLGATTGGGLPAVQLAIGVQVIAEPNIAYGQSLSQNRSFDASSSQRLRARTSCPAELIKDGLWISANQNSLCEKIILDDNDNILFGSRAGDHGLGSNGDDDLFGHGRADTLKGGPGSDFISGGVGVNWLYGGAGPDVFEFDAHHFSKGFKHKILDFNPDKDVLWFTKGWLQPHLSAKGNLLRYSGKTIGILEGLEADETVAALENALFI